MSEGRWKYKTETVTVDGNTQVVRMLTAGERRKFAEMSARKKKDPAADFDLPGLVLGFGTKLTPEDIEAMPPDLYEACCSKILELTGLKTGPAVPDDELEPEKKMVDPSPSRLSS